MKIRCRSIVVNFASIATVKIGIVEQGLVGPPHLEGCQTHPRAEVVAVCDLPRERALSFAQTHHISQVYTSYQDIMTNADINTADIALLHFYICL